MSQFTVGQLCRVIDGRFPNVAMPLTPRDITETIYRSRILSRLPVVSGRRLIPSDDVDAVIAELKRAGKLQPVRKVQHV